MRTRLTVVGTLTSVVAVVIAASVTPVTGQAQAPAAKAPAKGAVKTWTVPKMPWGAIFQQNHSLSPQKTLATMEPRRAPRRVAFQFAAPAFQ